MHTARVALRIPPDELHPMHAFVCESPAISREVILEHDVWDDQTTLLLHVDGDRDAYEEAIAGVPQVTEWTTQPATSDEGFYVYLRTALRDREAGYREVVDRDGVLIVPPVEIRGDRTVRQTMVGRGEDIAAGLEGLPDSIEVEVLRTGSYDTRNGGHVTDRQREALQVAWAAGYYEVPRTAALTTVADRLGCAHSTASDLLRRAERALVAGALGEYLRS